MIIFTTLLSQLSTTALTEKKSIEKKVFSLYWLKGQDETSTPEVSVRAHNETLYYYLPH